MLKRRVKNMAKKLNKAMIYGVDGVLKEVSWVDDSYKFLKNSVDGYVERVPLRDFEDVGIDVWCNEEGELVGLKPSIALTYDGKIYDCLVGNVVFTRYTEDGDTISLTDDDIKFIKDKFDNAVYHVDLINGLMLPMLSY